jgi:hypothetical protein
MEFKYQVGDRIFMKTAVDDSLMWSRSGILRLPKSFMILERRSQECPGGVQLHYKLSDIEPRQSVLEIEIGGLFDELDIQQFGDAAEAYKNKQQDANDERYEQRASARRAAKESKPKE